MYPCIVIVCIYSIYTYYIIICTQIFYQVIFTYHLLLLLLLYEHGHGCIVYSQTFSI